MRSIADKSEPKKRNVAAIAIGIGVAALVLSATGLGLLLTSSGPARPAPTTREVRLIISSIEPHNESMAMMMEEMHIYTPSALVVNRGDTIVLTIVNMDEHRHGFEIHALGVETDQLTEIAPGEEVVLTIEASQSGVFEWECNIAYDPLTMPQDCGEDHEEMRGYLVVQ